MLCSEKINYADYIDKFINDKVCILRLLSVLKLTSGTAHYVQLAFGDERVKISFEAR